MEHAKGIGRVEPEQHPWPTRRPQRMHGLLTMQRLAGNQAVSRLVAGSGEKASKPEAAPMPEISAAPAAAPAQPQVPNPAAPPSARDTPARTSPDSETTTPSNQAPVSGHLGPLSILGGLAAARPSNFAPQLSAVAAAVPAALAGERNTSSLEEITAPTGLAPGAPVTAPAAPTIVPGPAPATLAPSATGDGLADPSAADQCAFGGAATLSSAARQSDTPAPKLGGSLTPTVDPVALPAVQLPAAEPITAVPTAIASAVGREAAVLDAAGGSDLHRLVGGLLQPAAMAGTAHAAEAAHARTSAGQQITQIRSATEARQQALRASADEEVLQEHAQWSARRAGIVDTNTTEIHTVVGHAKAEISQTAQAAKSQTAQAAGSDTSVSRADDGNSGRGLWDRVKQGASAAVGAVKDAASAAGSSIAGILAAARAKINGLLSRVADAVRQRVTAAVNALRDGASRAWAAMRAALERAQQAITQLAQAAIDAAKRLRAAIASALARSWQRLVSATKSALAAAAGIGAKLGTALAKIKQILKLLDSPLLKFLIEAAGDMKGKFIDPLVAKAAPLVGNVPGMAKDLLSQQAARPQAQPTITLQRQPATGVQPAGDFAFAVDRQMTADLHWLSANWRSALVQVIGNILWPVYLFTEEAPALCEECKGLFSPAPGLDRVDHFLGIARHLTNLVNGTLATLGVWAGIMALCGGPVAEFFTVGAYYSVSLVMIQVDLGLALVQLLKYWYSGSRPDITQDVQSRYAKMYSGTGIGAILTGALAWLGIIAARFGAKVKGLLPKESVKPVGEGPVTPVEDKPPTVAVPDVVPTTRPHATPQQLREMIASGEYYTHRNPNEAIVKNGDLKFTGENTPHWDENVPKGVHFTKGVKGVNYGDYGVVIRGGDYPLRATPDALEFVLPEGHEVPNHAGHWFTAEDYAEATGASKAPKGGDK